MFYNGLNGSNRTLVDTAAGGALFKKSAEEAHNLLEEMAINHYQWPSERATVTKVAGIYEVDPIVALTAQISTLATQVAALTKPQVASIESATATNMQLLEGNPNFEQVQYVNNRNFNSYRGNLVPNRYHPNLSYANTENTLKPYSGFDYQRAE